MLISLHLIIFIIFMKYENVVYENVDLIEITDKRFMKLENTVHATVDF